MPDWMQWVLFIGLCVLLLVAIVVAVALAIDLRQEANRNRRDARLVDDLRGQLERAKRELKIELARKVVERGRNQYGEICP